MQNNAVRLIRNSRHRKLISVLPGPRGVGEPRVDGAPRPQRDAATRSRRRKPAQPAPPAPRNPAEITPPRPESRREVGPARTPRPRHPSGFSRPSRPRPAIESRPPQAAPTRGVDPCMFQTFCFGNWRALVWSHAHRPPNKALEVAIRPGARAGRLAAGPLSPGSNWVSHAHGCPLAASWLAHRRPAGPSRRRHGVTPFEPSSPRHLSPRPRAAALAAARPHSGLTVSSKGPSVATHTSQT